METGAVLFSNWSAPYVLFIHPQLPQPTRSQRAAGPFIQQLWAGSGVSNQSGTEGRRGAPIMATTIKSWFGQRGYHPTLTCMFCILWFELHAVMTVGKKRFLIK